MEERALKVARARLETAEARMGEEQQQQQQRQHQEVQQAPSTPDAEALVGGVSSSAGASSG